MLIDDITIKVAAGNGGKGAVAFNKNAMALGPAGGRGGNGGSVYLEGISDLSALSQFRYKKNVKAMDGADGKTQFSDGPNGDNLILRVPVGTVLHMVTDAKSSPGHTRGFAPREVLGVGERILIAQGGHGGKGNFLFRGPKNTSPTEFQEGLPGEHFTARLELKLIAHVGLIGLPNAGKSSLINELTKANSKVANYPFTTLEPSLGVHYDLILADIPGLIEGASTGKGLGIKFLRHIERTKILFHLISAESGSPANDYRTIKKELKAYNPELIKKIEYVFLSKTDTVSPKEVKKKITVLKKLNKNILPISIHDWDSMEKVKKILNKIQ